METETSTKAYQGKSRSQKSAKHQTRLWSHVAVLVAADLLRGWVFWVSGWRSSPGGWVPVPTKVRWMSSLSSTAPFIGKKPRPSVKTSHKQLHHYGIFCCVCWRFCTDPGDFVPCFVPTRQKQSVHGEWTTWEDARMSFHPPSDRWTGWQTMRDPLLPTKRKTEPTFQWCVCGCDWISVWVWKGPSVSRIDVKGVVFRPRTRNLRFGRQGAWVRAPWIQWIFTLCFCRDKLPVQHGMHFCWAESHTRTSPGRAEFSWMVPPVDKPWATGRGVDGSMCPCEG